MRPLYLFACLLISICGHWVLSAPALAQRPVVIGYQKVYAPWIASVGDAALEKITGRKIIWMPFEAAPAISLAMDGGLVQVGLMNSAGIAAAASRDVEIQVVWAMGGNSTSSTLVSRTSSGLDIAQPDTLKGKKLAVPFFSVTHAHAVAHLKSLNVEFGPVQLVNMGHQQLVPALQAGLIDGAFVPNWAAPLFTAAEGFKQAAFGEESGTPVFYATVADRTFVGLQPDFLLRFARYLADASDSFQKERPQLSTGSATVVAVAEKIGGSREEALAALNSYAYPARTELRTSLWLGGGRESNVARMLRVTGEVLRTGGRVFDVHEDYSPFVTEEFAEAVAASAPLAKTGP